MFYWNARKSLYRARGARGQCPCQNPSDSGEALRTGCEAVIGWRKPERFRRVCPLLVRNEAGAWVCRVAAPEVRPFWGRVGVFIGGATLIAAFTAGVVTFGFMRSVGYRVSPRQVFWPPAWTELRGVRAELFVAQAQAHYRAGRTREAMLALGVAQELDPRNYTIGMTLADFYQAAGSPAADDAYARLLREHPEHRAETAQVWFRGLLRRGRLEDIAVLARIQLENEGPDTAAWTHALVFAAQKRQRPDWLEIKSPATIASPGARAVVALAQRVQQATNPSVRRDLLVQTPLATNFDYDRVYRAEQLIREGFTLEAGSFIGISRGQLSGNDLARLTLAADAAAGNRTALHREFSALLAAGRPVRAAELSLLALHLVSFPDPELLALVSGASDRLEAEPLTARGEAWVTVFCAAGVQGRRAEMDQAKARIQATFGTALNALNRLEGFFLHDGADASIQRILPGVFPLSLELNYALLDRY